MKILLPTMILAGLVAAVGSASTGWAQDKAGSLQVDQKLQVDKTLLYDVDAVAKMRGVAKRYLDSSTVAVAEIDLERIDAAGLTETLEKLASVTTGGAIPDQAARLIQQSLPQLRAASASRVYAIASVGSLQSAAQLFVIPCKQPAAVDGVLSRITTGFDQSKWPGTRVTDDALLIGPPSILASIDDFQPAVRDDLMEPIESRDGFDHSLVVALPAKTRSELASLWPDALPDSFAIQFSPRQLLLDADRLTIQWSLPPSPSFRSELLATDVAAAGRIKKLADKAIGLIPDLGQSIKIKANDRSLSFAVSPRQLANVFGQAVEPAVNKNLRMSRLNDVKQVLLAFHNYHDAYSHLPPRCWTDKAGKPLLSWRVAVLPFMDQQAMYQAIDQTNAWDSKENRLFTQTVIPVFSGMRPDPQRPHFTRLRAPVFPGSLWEGEGPPKQFRDVIDGLSNTVGVIVGPPECATPWMSPEPWVISKDDPMKDVFGDEEGVIMARLDGSVRYVKKTEMTNEKLAALLTIAGREVIND